MIAEEYRTEYQISSSIPKGTTITFIIACFKSATPFYKKAISQSNIKFPLNENKLTQIFVEQIDVQLRNRNCPFGVKNQYCDIFFNTKGIPDFYFHNLEEGKVSIPLFIVEAKRLPTSPPKKREKEYVIGYKSKEKKTIGGIERFKNEKHGKGLTECGMLGFIEKETSSFWKNKINKWIEDLSKSDINWNKNELIIQIENKPEFSYLTSVVHINAKKNLILHHFWIN